MQHTEITPPRQGADMKDLGRFLSIDAWADRDLPQSEPLLGDLVTANSRMFIVGATGLGKTMLGLGMAHGMATGAGFLHWRSARPARVLYIDGEMATELIRARSRDAMRRAEIQPAPGMLAIYSRDFESETGERFPSLGTIPPLNTPAGHDFVFRLIEALGGVDVAFFDNLMSLTEGDQKDEATWSGVQPLVSALSARRIGQVWFDHTGHDKSRQYGASTKAWRMDTVAVMTAATHDRRNPADLAFHLSFDAPQGKARRRTPANRADFAACTIRLDGDQWSSSTASAPADKPANGGLSKAAQDLHAALMRALAQSPRPGSITREEGYRHAARLGCVPTTTADDSRADRDRKRAVFRKYLGELRAAGWIEVSGETIRDLRGPARWPPLANRRTCAEPSAEPWPRGTAELTSNLAEPQANPCRTTAEPETNHLT